MIVVFSRLKSDGGTVSGGGGICSLSKGLYSPCSFDFLRRAFECFEPLTQLNLMNTRQEPSDRAGGLSPMCSDLAGRRGKMPTRPVAKSPVTVMALATGLIRTALLIDFKVCHQKWGSSEGSHRPAVGNHAISLQWPQATTSNILAVLPATPRRTIQAMTSARGHCV